MSDADKSEVPTGAIIYTDGGARPTNPGYAGYGFHGYVYSDVASTKGCGNSKWNTTNVGYNLKAEKEGQVMPDGSEPVIQVTPISYVDGFGTVDGIVTNNVAEVVGLTRAVTWASKQELKKVTFYTDNKGVVEAACKWIQKWQSNGWVKSNGEPVANQRYLQDLSAAMVALEQNVPSVQYKWIKGHNGDLGNESSDKLATLGTLMAMNDVSRNEVTVQEAQGYWNGKVDRNPLLDHKSIYFLTDAKTISAGEYYTGSHGDDELLGVRGADAKVAYVVLTQPDIAIEALRNRVSSLAINNVSLCHILLPKVFKPQEYATIVKHGGDCIYRSNQSRYDFNYLDREPIVKEFNPPFLAHKAIEELNYLKALHIAYADKSKDIYCKDITDKIYTSHPKKGYVLNASVGAGLIELNEEIEVDEGRKVKVIIQVGHDVLSRNMLKRLESKKPVINILCWKQSPQHVRYATHVLTDEGSGIYAGFSSNAVWMNTSSK